MSDETLKRAPMKLWLRLLLIASLALNLIVIGLVVGVIRHGPPAKLAHGEPFGGPYLRAMDKDDRRAIIKDLRENSEGRRTRAEVQADFDRIIAALRATPYQADLAEEIILGQFKDIQTRAQGGTQAMLAHLRAMSDAQRAVYADRLEQALKRGPGRGHDHADRGGKRDWHHDR